MAVLCWVSFSFVLICCITNVCSQECRYKWQCEGKLCCKGPQTDEGVCTMIESTDSTYCGCEDDSDCPHGKTCSDYSGDDESICSETTDAYQPEPFTSPEDPTIPYIEPVTGYEWNDSHDDTDTESSGYGTLYLIIFVAIFVKGFLWCACLRIRYRSYLQLQRTVTLLVAQTKLKDGRQNTASPRASCDVEMQLGNAYSNAAVVDVDEGTPPLPYDAPPPYIPPKFEQSKYVNKEPAHVVEMQTGSFAPNPRRAVAFQEEEASLLPATAGPQSKGSEEFKRH